MTRPDKATLLDALRARLERELRTLRESQRAAQEAAVHEEARQEDPKDTRAIESQYIARGLAERVEDLRRTQAVLAHATIEALGADDPIGLFTLVGLKEAERVRLYFVVPVAGGETLEVAGTSVQTVTPTSPLGQALLGRHVDDDITLKLPGRRLSATVEWID